MSSRATALTSLLRQEFIRVGRPGVVITLEADERTVTLVDGDGRWRGPVPVAYGALVACEDGEGSTAQFWQRLAAARASA
jgi:hypothetical protein